MGIMDGFTARRAMMQHQKGDTKSAMETYAALYEKGYIMCSYLLPYTVLLLRAGGEENYLKVKEILKKAEKAPDVNDENRQQIFTNYATAQYKLGNLAEAINLLEKAHARGHCGVIYEILGYLYIESGDAEKAVAYNMEALDYDDEDAITLDNLGQLYYRLLQDKETAKKYFDKAYEIKPGQIDTLYFLAQYDLEAGKKDDAVEKLQKTLEGRFSPLNYATKAMIEKQLQELGA